MRYQQTTQVPNEVFDTYLPQLQGSELKIFLIIIRQTLGWVLPNGQRKHHDRMNYAQFIKKTNLSRRVISDAIISLHQKGFIKITDQFGTELKTPESRKGKVGIYYSTCLSTCAENNHNIGRNIPKPVQKMTYNKSYFSKLNIQKDFNQGERKLSDSERIQEIVVKQNRL